MKNKVNVGLIGIGRLGSMYAEFISQRVPQANFVAVADLIPERAEKCAEKLGLAHWFDNHHDLIACKDIEAVIITATTVNHKEIVLDAASEGKFIFCEKPMTLNLADSRAVQKIVAEKGVFYQQGFQRRFDKGFAAAKQKIEEGVIGTPVLFRGASRDPYRPSLDYLRPENSGGQLVDMAIHDIDIARWYMGDIKSVFTIGGVLAYPEVAEVGDTDNAIMVFTFENNSIGEIDISRNGIYGYDIRAEVQGTKGAIQAGYLRETPILVLTENAVTHDVVPYFPQRFREAYVSQLHNFIENLTLDRQPQVTIDDGIAALQVAIAGNAALAAGTVQNIKDF
jgi:scyllo-inositol 2-dehydrogenase (NAD+)